MARTIERTITAVHATEGGGVSIRRAFPTATLDMINPFPLLDHLGPLQVPAGEQSGFPDHPHRGFETVTYLLEGQFEHKDSFGNRGLLGPGDVQWMTAGSGLVHSEMPGPDLVKNGGTLHGFQLWVNLPRKDKMTAPRYQELKAAEIPGATAGGVSARVITGEALGRRGAVETRSPMLYVHLTIEPGAAHTQTVPRSWNVFAYHLGGEREGKLDIYDRDADDVVLTNGTTGAADVLLIGGEPIDEPVARYGPFVMNSREELVQAAQDFQSGKMGHI